MKIPAKLFQFNKTPTLLIVTGDYEAKFYVAYDGIIEDKKDLRFSMRVEGKEKQAYVHTNPAPEKSGAISHRGPYHEDLENKFHKNIRDAVYNLIYDEKIEDVYIFAPKQRINGIYKYLKTRAKNKVKGKFTGEYTKHKPIELIKIWEEKHGTKIPGIIYTQEEKKILDRPKIKNPAK